uniref:Conjugal transfer protein TraG n=1 Tax=Meloidogyne hapla TaxID=6305 RepID=A0A1I8BJQ4_MELHA
MLEFFGWFGNTLTRNILTWLQVSPIFLWRAMNIAGIILVPILALYAPVLYIMSKDYGRAFNNCFGFHFPFTNRHDTAGSSIIRNKTGQTMQHVKISKVDFVRPWTNIQTPTFVEYKSTQKY